MCCLLTSAAAAAPTALWAPPPMAVDDDAAAAAAPWVEAALEDGDPGEVLKGCWLDMRGHTRTSRSVEATY